MALNIPETVKTQNTPSQDEAKVNSPVAVQDTTPANAMALRARSDDDGFGASMDDDLGFGSFPIVKLDDGKLMTEDLEFDELKVRALQARSKYLIKARYGQEDGIPFVYSYDNETAVDGRKISDYIHDWKADGEMENSASPIASEYKEVVVEVVEGEGLVGEIVILNVAPASKARLAGYNAKLRLRGKDIRNVVTLVKPGPKITKGKNSFRPWDFSEAV